MNQFEKQFENLDLQTQVRCMHARAPARSVNRSLACTRVWPTHGLAARGVPGPVEALTLARIKHASRRRGAQQWARPVQA